MVRLYSQQNDPEIFKKALGDLLKRKDYHAAAPTKKNKMLREEYARFVHKGKELIQQVLYQRKKEKRSFERITINAK